MTNRQTGAITEVDAEDIMIHHDLSQYKKQM